MKEGLKLGKTTVSGVVSTQLKPKGKTLANKTGNKVPNNKKSLHNGVENME